MPKPEIIEITDVTRVARNGPFSIAQPVWIDNGKELIAFLDEKGVRLPNAIIELIADNNIPCKAFYYRDDGPLLIMFALDDDGGGLISTLTGDETLGALFDMKVKGAAVRVFSCNKNALKLLNQYVLELEG